MKKVLHVLSSNKFSGAENVVCQIINMFNIYDNYKMAYCSPMGPISKKLEQNNINFIGVDKLSINNLKKVIKDYNPDVIHAHDAKASVLCCMATRGKKIISHIHGNHDNMKIATLKSILYLLSSFKYEHIFWVSNSCLDGYKYNKFLQEKSSILYNVIDTEKIIQKVEEDTLEYNYDCIFVGRLCDIKNPIRLINILNKVIKIKKNTRCAIVGEGDLKNKLLKFIKDNNIENNIDILGFKDNPFKVMSSSKVMIITSRYEGTPMCALEAMALGVPIVTTPTDGMVDIIEQGVNGYISDQDEYLVKYIVKIITDDSERDRISIECFNKSSKLNNIELYRENIRDVYEK